ncbi:MAG: hypothetical protein HY319_05920 [Armatimonadetes bacterium]|nr:hypothetical protein [Armatimonadota bacterium]
MKRFRLGATLIELLVYCSLLLLLLGAVYGTFSLSRRYYASVQAATESQQEAMKAMLSLGEELSQAAGDTLVDGVSLAGPEGVRFLSARTEGGLFAHDPGSGDLLWQRWVCIHRDTGTREVLVTEVPLPSPTTQIPDPGFRPTVADIAGSPGFARRSVARHIEELSFPAAAAGNFGVRLRSRVDAGWFPSGLTGPGDHSTQVTLWSEIPIRH